MEVKPHIAACCVQRDRHVLNQTGDDSNRGGVVSVAVFQPRHIATIKFHCKDIIARAFQAAREVRVSATRGMRTVIDLPVREGLSIAAVVREGAYEGRVARMLPNVRVQALNGKMPAQTPERPYIRGRDWPRTNLKPMPRIFSMKAGIPSGNRLLSPSIHPVVLFRVPPGARGSGRFIRRGCDGRQQRASRLRASSQQEDRN